MKKGILSTLYAIAFPYLMFAVLFMFLKNINSVTKLWVVLYVLGFIAIGAVGIVACVMCNLSSIIGLTEAQSTVRYFFIKLLHLPMHLIILLIVCGFLNPWLVILSWVPFTFTLSLLVYEGCLNITTCIKLYRNGRCSFKKALLFGFLGFIYVFDYIGIIAQGITARKTGVKRGVR